MGYPAASQASRAHPSTGHMVDHGQAVAAQFYPSGAGAMPQAPPHPGHSATNASSLARLTQMTHSLDLPGIAQCHQCLKSCKAYADDAQSGPAGDSRGATSAWSLCASTHSTPCRSGLILYFLLQVHCCCGSPSVQVQIKGSKFCSSCTTSSA